jgi:DNA recombination protein Rad52
MFTNEIESKLKADLARSAVSERKQAGRALSYVESWYCIAEANRIFGFGNWDRETVELKCVHEHGDEQDGGKWKHYVTYTAKVRIAVRGVDNVTTVREGCGAGHGKGMGDCGDAHESALKEAESDAMKRALMSFGNSFGLALYDKSQSNVVDVDKQNKFVAYCADVEPSIVKAVLSDMGFASTMDVPQAQWKIFCDAIAHRTPTE